MGVFVVGSVFALLAAFNLGPSLRVGLPTTKTLLKTSGLYRFSRNPIYTGLFFACIASVIYCPHLLNLISCVFAITVHHYIILREEIFLLNRFGEQWHTYCRHTNRYITLKSIQSIRNQKK